MAKRKEIYWVRGEKQLAVLASPARMRIMDRMEAIAPCSVRELARSLETPPDRLYYHVELLVKAGLLVEKGRRRGRTRREAIYALKAPRWHIDYRLDDPTSRMQLGRITDMMMRQASRDFCDGMRSPRARVKSPARNLWSLRLESHLTDKQVREVDAHLQSIISILRHSSINPRGRLHAVSWVIAPVGNKGHR